MLGRGAMPNRDGVGFNILSCSSARRRVSRKRRSERLGGRGIGGRWGSGTVELRGEEGLEVDPALDLDRRRALDGGGGELGRGERTGVGACICIDMARVGRARNGMKPGLMEKRGGEAVSDDLRLSGMKRVWSVSDRKRGEGRRGHVREKESELRRRR